MLKIKNTSEIENHKLKTLVYGPSGHGKTTLLGTSPWKTLVISAESGLLSLKDTDYVDISVDNDGKFIERPKDRLKRLYEIYQALMAGTNYQHIALDSLTEISQVMVAALNEEFPDRKDSLVLWSENLKRMRLMAKMFRDMPQYHVTLNALAVVDKDENQKRYWGIDLAGKIADQIPALFDEVFYLSVDQEGKRKLITQPRPGFVCKDRSGKLLEMEEASLTVVAGKIFQKKEEKK